LPTGRNASGSGLPPAHDFIGNEVHTQLAARRSRWRGGG
jgi:hypothetical protein